MKTPLLILLLTAGLAASCIYPFQADVSSEIEDALVVEGDIRVGGITNIKLGRLRNLDGYYPNSTEAEEFQAMIGTAVVTVEDESGNIYEGICQDGEFIIDTKECDATKKHRLVIKFDKYRLNAANGTAPQEKTFESDWLDVRTAPVIDSLSVNPDAGREAMFIGLSCHSDEEQYFKWDYEATWEYHSEFKTSIMYLTPVRDTDTWNNGHGIVVEMGPEDQTWECWNTEKSKEILTFETTHQSDNRFVDLEFISIPQDSYKIMDLYRVTINIESMSEEAYTYWDQLNKNSSMSGDLFSTIPSELAGNIRCTSDEDAVVVGYISASTIGTVSRYIDNSEYDFYKPEKSYYPEPEILLEKDWLYAYKSGLRRPYMWTKDDSGKVVTYWIAPRCVDCRIQGGDTKRPEDWPK